MHYTAYPPPPPAYAPYQPTVAGAYFPAPQQHTGFQYQHGLSTQHLMTGTEPYLPPGPRGLVPPHTLLMKVQGVKGRVAQDQLNESFDADPMAVVQAFERQVVLAQGGSTHELAKMPHHALLGVWRETVPAKEHAMAARTGEILCDVYRHLREGRTPHALARTALALGALEQSVRDGGKWALRAGTLVGMPEAPLHRYAAMGSDTPATGKLGKQAVLVDPVRASAAKAVWQDAQS